MLFLDTVSFFSMMYAGLDMVDSFQDPDKYQTISIESKIREGVFHKVVKDLETGKAVSCSCKCWSKGKKQCAAMRTIN